MNKEIELAKRLEKLGVTRSQVDVFQEMDNLYPPWTIESAFAWLREKGWAYFISQGGGSTEVATEKLSENSEYGCINYETEVDPGHELEGLLECMVKIEEGG